MTALCGGGTSSAIPGAQAVTLLASGFLAVALDLYGAPWLKWALPFLGLPELTLVSFCASDPPAIPTFTAAESKALMDVTLGADFNSGLSKFSDLVQHLAWYQLCQCTSGALTALPAAPAPPAGTPVWTPPPGVTPASCLFVPGGVENGVPGGAVNFSTTIPTNINATSVLFTVNWQTAGVGPHGQVTFPISFTVPGLVGAQGSRELVPALGVQMSSVIPVPPGATSVTIGAKTAIAGNTDYNDFVAQAYCNGSLPGVPSAPCCPPNPETQLQLDAILRMVTLLQRQLVPFAYISSTAHAGLTGQGTIAVQGLLGLRIDLTTMPASLTQDASTPPFVFNVGWVSIEDANGFIDETRAHAQHQNWFSRIASEATLIGYSFAPGVVATITELQREP